MAPVELKRRLDEARAKLEAAMSSLGPKHKGGEWERYENAHDRCMEAERDLGRSLGEECAVEIPWPAPWDIGAPLPFVVAATGRTFVVYHRKEDDPNWDGSYAHVVDPETQEQRPIAVVEFRRCLVHKFGAPNDEAIDGHRLTGRGLVAYRAHTVERSRWLAENESINSVHARHSPEAFAKYTHYVLAFHDETFECLAHGFEVRTYVASFSEALQRCASEVLT